MNAARSDNRRPLLPDALRWGGGLLVVAMAVMRCVTLFGDQIVFDVDPATDPLPLAGLGPPGSLWISIVLLLAAAAALTGEALSSRRIEFRALLFACIPLPLLLWRAAHSLGALWHGVTWLAAIVAAVALLHLGRDRRLRIVLIALLASVIAPLLVRGAANATYEHQETIRQYEMRKAQILDEKGWAEDSPSTLIFERRMTMSTSLFGLELGQPIAWFVTTNIFGSYMGFGLIMLTGLGLAAFFARMQSGWPALLGLMAAACAIGLYLTQSKGALLTTLGGLVLLAPVAAAGVRSGRLRATSAWKLFVRAAPFIAVVAIVLALFGVLVRGVVLPEDFAGEKSLLYRWHYTVASAEIFLEHPLAGVDSESFQSAYTRHRPPRNPEEVSSAHNVLWDWLVSYGIWGFAWVALFFALLWRSGAGVSRSAHSAALSRTEGETTDTTERRPSANAMSTLKKRDFIAPVAAATAALVPAVLIEAHALGPLDLAIRVIAIAGYIGCAAALMIVLGFIEHLLASLTVFAAAAALAVHGQIETTFVLEGSAVWAMSILGLAAASGSIPAEPAAEVRSWKGAARRGWQGLTAGAVLVVVAVWLTFTGALPATRQQGYMLEAAAELRPIAHARIAMQVLAQEPDPAARREAADQLVSSLRAANVEAGAIAEAELGRQFDPRRQLTGAQWERLHSILRDVELQQRLATEPILLEAHEALPTNKGPLVYLAKQLDWAQQIAQNKEQRIEILRRAADYLQHWVDRGGGGGSHLRASYMYYALAVLSDDPESRRHYMQRTLAIGREMVERDPNGVQSWKRLGDVLWEFGDQEKAAEAYREALERNANFQLDPLKQLPGREVEEIERRIVEAG